MRTFLTLMRRELLVAGRTYGVWLEPLAFFSLILLIFPLVTTVERGVVLQIAPGLLWLAALLAGTLSVERLLASDDADGILEQMLCSPRSLPAMMLLKAFTHWLTTGVPLSLLAPVYGFLWFLSEDGVPVTIAALLLGTWLISLLGLFGAALTVRLRRGRLLLALLSLPLYIPGLVFGSAAMTAAGEGMHAAAPLALLAALVVLATALAPYAAAAAVRVMLD